MADFGVDCSDADDCQMPFNSLILASNGIRIATKWPTEWSTMKSLVFVTHFSSTCSKLIILCWICVTFCTHYNPKSYRCEYIYEIGFNWINKMIGLGYNFVRLVLRTLRSTDWMLSTNAFHLFWTLISRIELILH